MVHILLWKEKLLPVLILERSDYDNNDFPDALFPNYIFPPGNTAEQVTAARNVAKTDAVNAANDVANDARNLM